MIDRLYKENSYASAEYGFCDVSRVGYGAQSRVYREGVDGFRLIRFSGVENGRGKVGFVGRVGKVLGLEAKTRTFGIGHPIFANDCAVEKVAAVELYTRLRCGYLHDSARLWIVYCGDLMERTIPIVNDPIVVVSSAIMQLFIVSIDIFTHSCWRGEVHWCLSDGANYTRGDQASINGGEVGRFEYEFVVEDVVVG